MPYHCCAVNCKGNYRNGPKVAVFSFPKDAELRRRWLQAICRKDFTVTAHSRICELHFAEDALIKETTSYDIITKDFIRIPLTRLRLKEGAVPTRFDDCPKFNRDILLRDSRKSKFKRYEERDIIHATVECMKCAHNYEQSHTFQNQAVPKMRASEGRRKKSIGRQPIVADVSKHQTVKVGSRKEKNMSEESSSNHLAEQIESRKERNTSDESLSSPLVEPKKEINLSEESLSSHQSEQIESRKERNVSEDGLSSHLIQQVGPRKEMNMSEESLSNHLVQLVEPKKEMNMSEESVSSHLVQQLGQRKEMIMPEESLSNHLVQLVEPKKERNMSEEGSTSFSNNLTGQVELRKDSTLSEESERSNLPVISCNSQDKSYCCLDDLTEEDMDSPEKSLQVFLIAKMLREENRKIKKSYKHLVKRVAKLENVLMKMKQARAIAGKFGSVLEGLTTEVDEEKDQSSLEKQDITVEPTIRIKEEPVNDYSTPSTSNSTSSEEFILPHIDLPWTPTSPVKESQLTLSVASLNSPTAPEHSDGAPQKKKLRTDSSNITTGSASILASVLTTGSTLTRLSVPIVPSNHIDISIAGSLVGHQKKSTQNIILEAESSKYLNQTQDIKPTIRIKEEPADDYATPSSSSATSNGEFNLPHVDVPWTTTRPVVESPITLSIASLNSPNVPEPADGEPLNKKLRTDSPNITIASASTLASVSTIETPLTLLSMPTVPSNHIDISTPGFSVDHQKDELDSFGHYVNKKFSSLDPIPSAILSPQNVILEAEMDNCLNLTQDIKPTIRIKEEPAEY